MKKLLTMMLCIMAFFAITSCSKKEEEETAQNTIVEQPKQEVAEVEPPAPVVQELPADKLKRTAAVLGTLANEKTYTGADGRTWSISKMPDGTYKKTDDRKLVQKFSTTTTKADVHASCPKFTWKPAMYNGSVETFLGYSILNDGASFKESNVQSAYNEAKLALDEYLASK